MFAVIEIEQWYDGCESMECLATFNTKQGAEAYKKKLEDETKEIEERRLKYITDFVMAHENELVSIYLNAKEVICRLCNGHPCSIGGFDPPSTKDCKRGFQLWIVPIKSVSSDG